MNRDFYLATDHTDEHGLFLATDEHGWTRMNGIFILVKDGADEQGFFLATDHTDEHGFLFWPRMAGMNRDCFLATDDTDEHGFLCGPRMTRMNTDFHLATDGRDFYFGHG